MLGVGVAVRAGGVAVRGVGDAVCAGGVAGCGAGAAACPAEKIVKAGTMSAASEKRVIFFEFIRTSITFTLRIDGDVKMRSGRVWV